ncbi:hypothetical protein EVAR_36611_1 [Eumeta japonica]|uniref:Uncharacterized protein n=1 Tax=Eumeta variegata TaxID=151549 RepID=A0A4C1ZQT4_EUMVA|nr:hypothetical protein EVAR_36611_1 [Eumeta japonica]
MQERRMEKENVVTRVEKGVLRWFGHLERMNEGGLTKQIYRADVCDERVDKNPRKSERAKKISCAQISGGAGVAPLLTLNDGHRVPQLGLGTWLGGGQVR